MNASRGESQIKSKRGKKKKKKKKKKNHLKRIPDPSWEYRTDRINFQIDNEESGKNLSLIQNHLERGRKRISHQSQKEYMGDSSRLEFVSI